MFAFYIIIGILIVVVFGGLIVTIAIRRWGIYGG